MRPVETGPVDAYIVVFEVDFHERVLTQHVMQLGAGMGPQGLAVAHQKIEATVLGNSRHQFGQGACQRLNSRHADVGLRQLLQQPTKSQFVVSAADWPEATMQRRRIVFQNAGVGEHPVATPKLMHKGVAVFQGHGASGRLAHMGDNVEAFDGLSAQHPSDGRGGGTLLFHEVGHVLAKLVWRCTLAVKKRDAPAVAMVVGTATALC